jgi:tetratricopeptide (TPR) repeat protein
MTLVRVSAGALLVLSLLGAAAGCSSAPEATGNEGDAPELLTPEHAQALQHFINASVYELQGEYAQAVLEYQDALRYEQNHAIYFGLSKNYSALGKHALALDAGKKAVELAPENLTYRRNLAQSLSAALQPEAAAEQYQAIIARDSSAADAWYGLARSYQPRQPLRAAETYEEMIRRFGPDWNILLQMAELYSNLGRHTEASAALEHMVELDPGNQPLRKSLGDSYVRAGDYARALATFTALVELDPDNLEYIAEKAGVHLLQDDYQAAQREFEKILGRDSVAIEAKLRIGELYFRRIEQDSTVAPMAREVFERIRENHPEDWRPYWFLGALAAMAGDDSASIENFTKVTELASWNSDGWVYLSSVFMGNESFEEMAAVLESALRVLPDDYRINFFLGIAYNRLGRNLDAVRVLEHARGIEPEDVDAAAQLALVYDTIGRHEESDSLYEEALRLDPENHLVLNNYAYSLAERGEHLSRALTMVQKALEAQPENASYLDTIGWVYFKLGRYEEARDKVQAAIDLGEVNAVVYEHLGDIYYHLKQPERAREHWHMALELDSSNPVLQEKVSRGSL